MSKSVSKSFKRGDLYWCELDPARGSEQAKTRPCVVVSATALNTVRKTVVVIPLTHTPSPAQWPLLIELPSAGASSKARIEQIRAIDKSRATRHIGSLGRTDLGNIAAALKAVLDMEE